jgi:uncharacterized protein (DUF885 family)
LANQAEPAPPAPADARFDQLAARYVDEVTAYSPVGATHLGDHRHDAVLDDVSPEARQGKAAFCRAVLDELANIPRGGFSRANQVDAAMLEHRLRSEIWHIEELREWSWNPMVYTATAGNAIYGLVARDFAPLAERLANAAARMEQIPRMLAQGRAAIDIPRAPKVHTETAIKQNPGVITLIETMIRPHVGSLGQADRRRMEQAIATARQAVEDHQKWLEGEVLPKAGGDWRLGAELFDRKLSFALSSRLTRQDIRKLAEAELLRVRRQMYDLAAEVYRREYPYTRHPAKPSKEYRQAIIRACLEMACRQTPDITRIVEIAQSQLNRLTDFVRSADIVTVQPDPVKVIEMPEFRRGQTLAYCDSPGPLDVGQGTFYAIAPPPADWSAEQVRSLLREYNTRSLENLTVHEAMPGHYLQITHSSRYPSTLRAMLSSGTFVEGWAVYTEGMMVERGAYGDDPLMKLIVLKWRLRAIANAILDQAVHVDGMTREQAMELMIEDTFQEEREAAGKWTRAQLSSAQLSTYFVGYLEHAAMRREMESKLGDKFNLKAYHDQLLSYGSPPTKYVRALMLDLPIEANGP